MMVKCPRCHAENNDALKFRGNCAAPLGRETRTGPEGAALTNITNVKLQGNNLVKE